MSKFPQRMRATGAPPRRVGRARRAPPPGSGSGTGPGGEIEPRGLAVASQIDPFRIDAGHPPARAAAAEQTARIMRRSRSRWSSFMCRRISDSAAASAPASGGNRKSRAVDPLDPAEAGDEVAALDHDAVEMEIAKTGIGGARRVVRDKAREATRIIGRLSPPEQGQARPGQGIGMALGGVEQQRDPRIERDVAAVLRQIGQQQQAGSRRDRRRSARAKRRARLAGWWRAPRGCGCAPTAGRASQDRGSIGFRSCVE